MKDILVSTEILLPSNKQVEALGIIFDVYTRFAHHVGQAPTFAFVSKKLRAAFNCESLEIGGMNIVTDPGLKGVSCYCRKL